jgi:hypothetical protein
VRDTGRFASSNGHAATGAEIQSRIETRRNCQRIATDIRRYRYPPETSAMKPATKRWISAGGRL